MALNLSSASSIACSNLQFNSLNTEARKLNLQIKCESKESSGESDIRRSKLAIGSPVIVIEAPKMIKTAASVPCLRANSGLVKPGDVGRIISRKPKDVWAVRLSIGTYLLEGKYFKPLELDE
ncbi:hypothetical protein CUMW_231460 [Citrus unshiu]|uniref:Chlororespiratory reduction 42 n=1 Tax=Citrus unshiu TaxID=55188 RepID=A0A2H5QHR3_CITUN|nr:hypothetical protein CUMW_231460 [Citrus unshiu]